MTNRESSDRPADNQRPSTNDLGNIDRLQLYAAQRPSARDNSSSALTAIDFNAATDPYGSNAKDGSGHIFRNQPSFSQSDQANLYNNVRTGNMDLNTFQHTETNALTGSSSNDVTEHVSRYSVGYWKPTYARLDTQQKSIFAAAKAGSLSENEFVKIEQDEHKIEALKASLEKDGVLSLKDRDIMNKAIDAEWKVVKADRSNGERDGQPSGANDGSGARPPRTGDGSSGNPTRNGGNPTGDSGAPTGNGDSTQPPAEIKSKDVGVPTDAVLTQHNGDIVITKPGTVIENMDIAGRIIVKAADVTIKNCRVRGDKTAPGYNTALIDCNSAAAKNVTIEDCTLSPDTPSNWTDGVIGHDYTANRVDTFNVVDGFGVYNNTGDKKNTNVTIENSYIHDLTWYAHDQPNHDNGTHNDGIQIQGGDNIKIIDNLIEGYYSKTAGDQNYPQSQISGQDILVQGNTSTVSNLLIEGNTLQGGARGINVIDTAAGNQPIGEIINNYFGRDQKDFGNGSRYQIHVETPSNIKFSAPLTENYWADSHEALAEGRDSGIRYGA